MAFVSDRQGNLDVYIQPLGQPGARAVRFTMYSGVDKAPAWSPDGKKIAFVSNREDPDGDIVVLELTEKEEANERESRILTGIDTADSYPSWSPDGKAIFFSSRPKTEYMENIWKVDIEKGTTIQLTKDGGTMPSVSPDGKYLAFVALNNNLKGNISLMRLSDGKAVQWTAGREADGSPAWDPSGKQIYFSRCADDTNLDGELSFQDNPAIWSVEFSEDLFQHPEGGAPRFRQLTSGDAYDVFPSASRDALFYTSGPSSVSQNVGTDIVSLPKSGAFPLFPGFKTAWEKVGSADFDSPYKRIMALRDLLLDFSPFEDPSLPAFLYYKLGKTFRSLNNTLQALENFRTVEEKFPSSELYAGLAKIESVEIKATEALEGQSGKKEDILSNGIAELEKLAEEFKGNPVVSGTAKLRMGDFYLLMGSQEKALALYDGVYNEYSGQRELAAEALASKSKIYLALNDMDKVVQAFLAVIRQFPDVREWSRKATEEILRLAAESGPMEKRKERLYQLSDKYADLSILPAAALNKAGELYYLDHENLKARQAYLRTLERFPHEKEEAAKAKFALAKIYFEEEDFEKTFEIYRELEVDPASAFQSKREFVSKLLSKGEKELQSREARLAVKTFKSIMEYDYEIIEAHRGLIRAYAALNQAADSVNMYRKETERLEKAAPPNPFLLSAAHYSLGLALTYLQPPQLEESAQHIQKAISLNGNSPYYFQTLGWLREQKYQGTGNNEHLESAADSYQTAISLNLAQGLAANLPDLWLNLGNAQYQIQNFGGAYQQYKKRMESKTPFGTEKEAKSRESIYLQRFGEVSFKLGKHQEAIEYFTRALSLAEGPEPEKNLKRIAELHARVALAYQDKGEYEKAVEYFGLALELYAKADDRGNIARTLRNMANNLYFSTQGKEDRAGRSETLNKALGRYFETVRLLEKGDLVPAQKKKKKTALIQVDMAQGLDEDSSRAAMGFSKADEEKLIFNYIGKIYGDFREYPKAVEYFKKKLSLTPSDLPMEGNVPVLLERAIIENQVGNYLYLSGDFAGALTSFQSSLEGSMKIRNNFGIAANALNMGKLCAESLLAGKPIEGPPSANMLELLDQASQTISADPSYIHNGVAHTLANQKGAIAFALSQDGMETQPGKREGDDAKVLSASLKELDAQVSLVKKSQKYFQEGLDIIGKIPAGKAKFNVIAAQSILESNLNLSKGAVLRPPSSVFSPPDLQWRLTFLSSATASSDEAEIKIINQAMEEFLNIPYRYKKIEGAEREMARELFARLAWLFMKSGKAKEGFLAAEQGREWELKAGHEGASLSFEDQELDQAYKKIIQISSQIHDLYSRLESGSNPEELEKWTGEVLHAQAAYDEALKEVRDQYPELVSLVSYESNGELLKNAQSLLEKDEAIICGLGYKGFVLEWTIKTDSLEGTLLNPKHEARNSKSEIPNSKYNRVYLISGPDTASLSWAPETEIIHAASLSHLLRSYSQRNLQTSNLLVSGGKTDDAMPFRDSYRNVSILTAGELSKNVFLQAMEKNGVVGLYTPVVLRPQDPAHAYLDLSGVESMVDRLETHELYSKNMEGYLMTLSNFRILSLPNGIGPELHYSILADALSHAGYPSILINTGAFDPKFNAGFMSSFFTNLRSHPPSEALLLTRKDSAEKFPGLGMENNYKLFGYGGMREEERIAFAQENLKEAIGQGMAAAKEQDWVFAIKNFEHALSFLDALETEKYRDILCAQLVDAAVSLQDYKKAIGYQGRLLEETLKLKEPEEVADAYHYLGYLYYKAEDFSSATENIQKALDIYKGNNLKEKMAEAYTRMGIAREKALDYQKALEAHDISREISAESGKVLNEGKQLNWMGSIHLNRLAEYGRSIESFQEALKILQPLKAWKDVLESLLGLGRSYQKLGRFDKAMEYFQQASDLVEEQKMDNRWAECRLEFANTYWFQGDYQKAFIILSAALEKAEKGKDKRMQGLIHGAMGLVYWTLNDSQKSLDNLERSLDFFREGKSDLDAASALNNMGLVHRDAGEYKEALDHFQKAMEIDTRVNSRWGLGYDHRNMGMTFLRMNDVDKAGEHIELAFKLSGEIHDRTNMVKAMLERGNIALKREKYQEALERFRETLALAEEINVKEVQWRAIQGEGRAMAKMGQRPGSIEKYKEAVKVVEEMRSGIKVEELRNGFAENKGELYEEIIVLLLDEGNVVEAFNFSERSRARSFIDLLGNQKITLKNSVDQEEFQMLQNMKLLIEETENRLKAETDQNRRLEIEKELRRQRDQYRDGLIAVKSKNPQLSNFVTVDPLTPEEIFSLLGPDITLLEYLVAEKEIIVWIVKKGSIKAVRIPVEKSKLTHLVKDFLDRVRSLAPMDEVSRELHNLLVRPVEGDLKGSRLVGLVPNGVLHYLSFSALRDAEGYLVEKYPLFQMPSASFLKFTMSAKVRAIPKETQVLAIGNPDLADFNYDLPLAELEANALRWDFPRIDVLTREKARESWVVKHIGEYDIIHIASHGEFDSVNPLFSSLKLTRDLESDGNLEVNEVFGLEINANLVTLSACQTGLGHITGGDELIGLNRAFFYAGAQSLISSLWRVSDVSTAILIKHFYRNYSFTAKAEALRKAQLLVKRYYPHPAYWAGFNLTGNYN